MRLEIITLILFFHRKSTGSLQQHIQQCVKCKAATLGVVNARVGVDPGRDHLQELWSPSGWWTCVGFHMRRAGQHLPPASCLRRSTSCYPHLYAHTIRIKRKLQSCHSITLKNSILYKTKDILYLQFLETFRLSSLSAASLSCSSSALQCCTSRWSSSHPLFHAPQLDRFCPFLHCWTHCRVCVSVLSAGPLQCCWVYQKQGGAAGMCFRFHQRAT